MATDDIPTLRKAKNAIEKGYLVGSGSYRKVYRTKTGKWVYKVDQRDSWGSHGNAEEYAAYQELIKTVKLPDGVKIPKMYKVGDYLAVQYIKGKHPINWCMPGRRHNSSAYHTSDGSCTDPDNCWATKASGTGINDLHNENVIVARDGTVYIIDIGHGADPVD